MDFLRHLFGLKFPREQPTVPENDGGNQSTEHPYFTPFTFSFSNELNSEFDQSPSIHSGGNFQEYDFMNYFQQIEQMMDMFQRAMSDFDVNEQGGYPPLMPPPPNSPNSSQNLTPRDRFLKTPDSHLPSLPRNEDEEVNASSDNSGVVRRPYQFHNEHSWHPGFGFGSIFRMMDELMKPFATDDFLRPDDGVFIPSDDALNGTDPHSLAPRETLLKEDMDLDKRPPQDLQELLKEGPGYSAGGLECRQPQSPTMRSNFTSTSISRTVRSDGVIEERRTYRDSSGREEVTVTEVDPATAQSLVPNPFSRDGSGFSSIFGKFF